MRQKKQGEEKWDEFYLKREQERGGEYRDR